MIDKDKEDKFWDEWDHFCVFFRKLNNDKKIKKGDYQEITEFMLKVKDMRLNYYSLKLSFEKFAKEFSFIFENKDDSV